MIAASILGCQSQHTPRIGTAILVAATIVCGFNGPVDAQNNWQTQPLTGQSGGASNSATARGQVWQPAGSAGDQYAPADLDQQLSNSIPTMRRGPDAAARVAPGSYNMPAGQAPLPVSPYGNYYGNSGGYAPRFGPAFGSAAPYGSYPYSGGTSGFLPFGGGFPTSGGAPFLGISPFGFW